MFTGIIECLGQVLEIEPDHKNINIKVMSPISRELKVDQSISHNGVCLTVTKVNDEFHWVTAIQETLNKTNLGKLAAGHEVNLERCLSLQDRLDGHIVQGHVDSTSKVMRISDQAGSWQFQFSLSEKWASFIVPRGSICVNGVSLTVAHIQGDSFEVAIIPYTFEHTTFKCLQEGQFVNLEFDIVGKYILRNQELKKRAD